MAGITEKQMKELVPAWDVVVKKTTKASKLGREIEEHLNAVAEKYVELEQLVVEAYAYAPKKDTHFAVSPLSPHVLNIAVKEYLFKRGLKWVTNQVFRAPQDIPDFRVAVDNGIKWLLKFEGQFNDTVKTDTRPKQNLPAQALPSKPETKGRPGAQFLNRMRKSMNSN